MNSEKLSKKYILFCIIAMLLVTDVVHESGHAIFGILEGGTITKFYPFPHFYGGILVAGEVGFSSENHLGPWHIIGSEILQIIVAIAGALAVWFFSMKKKFAFPVFVLAIYGWLDFPLYAINNYFGIPHLFIFGGVNGDVMAFAKAINVSVEIFVVLGVIQLIIGGIIFKKIYDKKMGYV